MVDDGLEEAEDARAFRGFGPDGLLVSEQIFSVNSPLRRIWKGTFSKRLDSPVVRGGVVRALAWSRISFQTSRKGWPRAKGLLPSRGA